MQAQLSLTKSMSISHLQMSRELAIDVCKIKCRLMSIKTHTIASSSVGLLPSSPNSTTLSTSVALSLSFGAPSSASTSFNFCLTRRLAYFMHTISYNPVDIPYEGAHVLEVWNRFLDFLPFCDRYSPYPFRYPEG